MFPRRYTLRDLLKITGRSFLIFFLSMMILGALGEYAGQPPQLFAQDETSEEAIDPADAEAPASDIEAGEDETFDLAAMRDEVPPTPIADRLLSLLGVFGFIGIAFLLSNNRKAIDWRLVGVGTTLQLTFALLVLKTRPGRLLFAGATDVISRLLQFTDAGSGLLFGIRGDQSLLGAFAFGILPTIIFFSSLMAILYHLGVMQWIVRAVAVAMQSSMRTSGSETLSAAANIFVGQTEAPLMIKPYVDTMTKSELMAIMTGGFATVAGGVMAVYVGMLSSFFPDIAGHLVAASVMSAPAALVIAKVMFPETEDSPTRGKVEITVESLDANVIDAAARGAGEGLTLALNVGAMLLAFVAIIAMINFMLGLPSYIQHKSALTELVEMVEDEGVELPEDLALTCDPTLEMPNGETMHVREEDRLGCMETITELVYGEDEPIPVKVWPVISLELIFGYLFAPLAFLMGVPWSDCTEIGQLLGTKMAVNEFVAYDNLRQMLMDPNVDLHPRSVTIATYALCGFANFGSIAIQIGGIGGIAPSRRHDIAQLGLKAMIAGTLAAFMTATIAGVLI